MSERRPQPDLDRVRDAMREHDRNQGDREPDRDDEAPERDEDEREDED